FTAGDRASMLDTVASPSSLRPFQLLQALRTGCTAMTLYEVTGIDPWFLRALESLVALETNIANNLNRHLGNLDRNAAMELLREAKESGLGDEHLGSLTDQSEDQVRSIRKRLGIVPVFKAVDTCAAEFPAETPYFYSTYALEDEGTPLGEQAVAVLGSGPNRIGQGIEFDYCCVVAAQEFRRRGRPVIMLNSNPETVSTDYDISDRLYFEPLTREHVTNVLEKEQPGGAVVQFGGQTPLKLAQTVREAGVPILGTSPEDIEDAENREKFRNLVVQLDLSQPRALIAIQSSEVLSLAQSLGYPVLLRPSHVLGGRGMTIVRDRAELELWLAEGVPVSKDSPVLIDAFLEDAVELDVDAVSDGKEVLVGAVLEHLEEAGVHSGDSCCMTPAYSIGPETEDRIRMITRALARSLNVIGLLNIQFAVKGDTIYILEANPRASRTVPFVSKATGMPLVSMAVGAMLGEELGSTTWPGDAASKRLICVKKPVLPFDRFPGEDTMLGPEMKSTGEVMAMGEQFGEAYAKAEAGAGSHLPRSGRVFLSIRDGDKRAIVFLAKRLDALGFELVATSGTANFLMRNGIEAVPVSKLGEGGTTAVDLIKKGSIQLVLNIPKDSRSQSDGKEIRAAALQQGVPSATTLAGIIAVVSGIEFAREGEIRVRALQDMLAPHGSNPVTEGVRLES
ncbi:MAG: carbamoyl-phosphate synthase large subunit, partial [Candidatus Eisenbacteria bacterium]|nr:carbamoyl-phosphate synthase large subunit [Candidatus Eisenbacteria bacterium]